MLGYIIKMLNQFDDGHAIWIYNSEHDHHIFCDTIYFLPNPNTMIAFPDHFQSNSLTHCHFSHSRFYLPSFSTINQDLYLFPPPHFHTVVSFPPTNIPISKSSLSLYHVLLTTFVYLYYQNHPSLHLYQCLPIYCSSRSPFQSITNSPVCTISSHPISSF